MSEEQIHRSILQYFRRTLPHGWLVMHVPNGGFRIKSEAKRLKGLGVMAGWPDIQILGAKGSLLEPWCGFVEVKTATGRVSDEQSDVHDKLRDCGFAVGVCRSIEDARDFAFANDLPTREIRLPAPFKVAAE